MQNLASCVELCTSSMSLYILAVEVMNGNPHIYQMLTTKAEVTTADQFGAILS